MLLILVYGPDDLLKERPILTKSIMKAEKGRNKFQKENK
jgi:hypothetical protein